MIRERQAGPWRGGGARASGSIKLLARDGFDVYQALQWQ
ncbi:hypothetical protein BIWAKO_04019 [Bosea sp. BIWAKO-01]|nr:hypothetical protein BIWAKO_04019 [Bosea sp. BIWAKO-01]